MHTNVDNNAPAARQAFKIETFQDRDSLLCALSDSDMSHTTKFIAMRLALYINVKSGRCDPAVPTLASTTGTSKSTVLRAIREMEAAGWLGVTRSRGGRSIDGIGYTHSFVFLDPNGVNCGTVGEGATVSNEPTYGVKNWGGNGVKFAGLRCHR